MTTQTTTSTSADSFFSSPAVDAAVRAIVEQLEQAQSTMTGARPPRDELAETNQQWIDRLGAVKGRGPIFPYIGTGLGNGPLVELADGSVKWDMINGIGVHMFGHSDPEMVATAVRAAMGDTVQQGNLQCNADAIEFAEFLLAEAGRTSKLKHCFMTNSGTMANESALKVCNQARNGLAPRVIAFADCFMGRSAVMSQIGDNAASRIGQPLQVLIDYIPFYDAHLGQASIDRAVDRLYEFTERYPGQHAVFTMELLQGEGGFRTAPREFFTALCEICRANDIPIWFDEVQTFGRTERMFHFEQLDLGQYADVVTLGKMSQVCACLYTEALNPKPGLLSGTFIGSSVGLQVGRRALERLRDGGYYGADGRNAKLHEVFTAHAEALIARHPKWFPVIRHPRHGDEQDLPLFGGVGGMMRLTPFGGAKAPVVSLLHTMFRRGVIAFFCGHDPYHIRFLPPIGVFKPTQFDEVFEILEASLEETATGLDT